MGTIRKRETASGKTRWDAQVYIGRQDGVPQFLSKTFQREGTAKKWVRQQETLKDSGDLKRKPSKETLAEYLERWLTIYAGDARPVTVYNYRATLRRWIMEPKKGVPPLGRVRLDRLSPKKFTLLYSHMREHGIQPRGIQYIHGIMRKALNDAVDEGELPKNPILKARVPTKAKGAIAEDPEDKKVRAMSREEAEAFVAAAAKEDRFSALWHVLLTGGLRPCEAFALKWTDVDFDAGEIHVRRTLTRVGLDKEDHPEGWALTPPKTKKSDRKLAFPAVTMRELRRWNKLQAWERRTFQGEYKDHGFVFTTEVGSPLDGSNLYRGAFRRVMEEAELGEWGPQPKKPKAGPTAKRPFKPAFRIYDLRHTHATLLLEDGEDLLVVSQRLGHSTIKLTADLYTSFMPTRQREAADRFDHILRTG